MIEKWTIRHTHYDAMRILQDSDIPAGAVLDTSDLVSDPHLIGRSYFAKGVRGSDRPFMGLPFRLSKSAGRVKWRGPDLGQHNEYVLHRLLGKPEEKIEPVREEEIGTAYDPE
jgi:crotonobetainyl-CoA:carnitine CoA-transferase CaiB-like acyl-CoA transferase